MSVLKAKIGGVLAAVAAAAMLTGLPGAANAQGLIEFLWGGEPEYGGGKRQIVSFNPQYKAGQIIVSFGDRRLYLITKDGQATSYPIAIPREQSRWQGTTVVSQKRENPDWRPTPDMLKENPKLPSWVPGGHPMNPLGVRALYLGSSTYRIHGTDAPWTIGQNVSKGCIRMFNEDVIDLYPKVPTGTKVVVTWERFKTNEIASIERTTAPGSSADFSSSSSSSAASAPAAESNSNKVRGKTRSVAAAPKTGFFIGSDNEPAASEAASVEADEGLTQDEGATVYTRNSDGTYSQEESSAVSVEEPKKVTRLNRKEGGSVSRPSQQANAVQ
jgi:lipoprotein-anchoring transpeptidase ErfK/SrfK